MMSKYESVEFCSHVTAKIQMLGGASDRKRQDALVKKFSDVEARKIGFLDLRDCGGVDIYIS